MATELWAIGLVILATMVGAGGPILLKKASSRLERAAFTNISTFISATAGNIPLVIGILIYALSFVIYTIALQGADLSVLYPLVSLSYVWVSLLSIRFLHERMNSIKWVGVVLIVSGAVLVGLGS